MRNRASRASRTSTERLSRRPSIRAVSFSSTDRLDLSLRQPGVAQRGLELGVGDERDPARQLRLTSGHRLGRDVGVVLDAREEAGGQRGDEDRADQRRPERGAEVGRGVLQAAHLAALLVGHRGDGDRAQLRGQRTDAQPGQQHRHRDDLGAGAGVERKDQRDDAGEQGDETPVHDAARRRLRPELGDADRGEEQGDRERQQADPGLEARSARAPPRGTAGRRRRGRPGS